MALKLMAASLASKLLEKLTTITRTPRRRYGEQNYCEFVEVPCPEKFKGLVLGVYTNPDDRYHPGKFTPSAEKHDYAVNCRMKDLLKYAVPVPELGEYKLFYDLEREYTVVALVGLGKECQGYDVYEQMDEGKEAIRIAAAVGCKALQPFKFQRVYVESFGHAESAAEGAALGVWLYQENRSPKTRIHVPHLELFNDCDYTGWQIGLQKAAAQNLARQLMDTSSNNMTPTSFAQNAVEVLCKTGINVEVKVRGWCEQQNMSAFLLAAQGSCEPPIFLELSYYGTNRDERPVVIIAKGLTYNSGGMCLKPRKHQEFMRGDMGGAACVVGACRAVASLQLPINIRALIPLCENMPGCAAMRSGDIVKACNGKSIVIETTDCAGRLCVADALAYSHVYWPRFIIDVGTMSGDMYAALGTAASGVFSNSEALWEYMLAASMHTGDRVWRMPLWEHFSKHVRHHHNVDVKPVGRSRRSRGNPCKTAAFLNEFVPCGDWLHLDMNNVIWSDGCDESYLREGMAGRPTRTLVEFLSQLVCNREQS